MLCLVCKKFYSWHIDTVLQFVNMGTKNESFDRKIFDISLNKVNSIFLDTWTTEGATATDIFEKSWQCY
jgi:hypothetical protein